MIVEVIEGKERRRLRLVIAIPALMVLITLLAGFINYEAVLEMADKTELAALKSSLKRAANTILLTNLIACIIALIFGVGLATYITRPIRAMTQKARKVVRGDLSMKLGISNPDEIGELGESFDYHMDHLIVLFKEGDPDKLEGFSEGQVSKIGRAHL